MIHKLFFTLFLVAFLAIESNAQVIINEEPGITQLMSTYKAENQKKTITRAWRIQILTTNDRREMEQGIKKFELLYPEMSSEWEHNPPYYQVRTGAYELRDDLEATLLLLKKDFPSAIPVQSEMKKTQLLK